MSEPTKREIDAHVAKMCGVINKDSAILINGEWVACILDLDYDSRFRDAFRKWWLSQNPSRAEVLHEHEQCTYVLVGQYEFDTEYWQDKTEADCIRAIALEDMQSEKV